MDRRSWLWRRKSSERSPGETESSGSMSSYSERYSDDQEILRASSNDASPNHFQSPELSSEVIGSEVHETIKSLSEKLSAALLSITAKEDLVKQHMKVAEEAVSGWETAETEVVGLKQQLEAAAQKNSALEDQIRHLDGALNESVRELRQSREEHEQKVHDVLMKKTREWGSDKFDLENRITELQVQLEANYDLQSKLEAAGKENMALKVELLARAEALQMQMMEKEMSTRAAESASKQHLESIKKVAKLESECRRLRAVARKASSAHDQKPVYSSVCVESLTDSHSDSGERFLGVETTPSCSDSWASALITELDQFKNEKARNLPTSSMDIDLMDDFLEMERLVSMPEANRGSSSFELGAESNPLRVELGDMRRKVDELEEKIVKMDMEKAELEMALADSRDQLELSRNEVIVANESNIMKEALAVEEKGKALESQLELANSEVRKLCEKVYILQGEVDKEKGVSLAITAKVEALGEERKALESQLELAKFEVKKLNEKVNIFEGKAEEEKAIALELVAQVEASEAKRKAIECQLEKAHLEIRTLHENAASLQGKIAEERSLSAEFAAKLEAAEAAKEAVVTQLNLAQLEVGELRDLVSLLEGKVAKEKDFSAQLAAKHRSLEAGLSWKKQEAELWRITSSNGELKVKQETEMAVAAGKLAECQKTIASLSSQLKSLTSFDDLVLELEKTAQWGVSGY